MNLNLRNLDFLSKAIQSSCPKTGDKRKDSIYFDFDEKKLLFHHDKFNGEISFDFKVSSIEESFTNFFIDMSKFLYILKDMDIDNVELIFEEKEGSLIPVFKKNSDIYKISYIISEKEDLIINLDENLYQKVSFNRGDISLIEQAAMFIDYHDDNSFNSVAVSNSGKVFGTTPTRFFEASFKTIPNNLFVHRDIIKVLGCFNEVDVIYNDSYFILKGESFRFIYIIGNCHSVIPSEEDKANVVSKDYSIVVNKKEFLETLKFFDPFYITDSKPIRITVEDEEHLKISTVSSYDVIEKTIQSKSSKEIIGFSAKYNAAIIKSAIGTISENELSIYVNQDKIGAVFTDSTNKKESIIIQYAESD